MRYSALVVVALVAAGCSTRHTAARGPAVGSARAPVRKRARPTGIAQSRLGLPPIRHGPVPGYLLIADRDNNRALIVSPAKRVVWQARGLRGPDDTFFTPGYRSVITNEEFNDTLAEVSLRRRTRVWRYGHDGFAGSSRGYLDSPDDAYRLPDGDTTIADIRNCRIVQLTPAKRVRRVLGGSCVHDPPRGFASPNGDTPLPDGGLLVTEIGGWIDRLARDGRLVWSVRSPVAYPSDAQLLPNGHILVAGFTDPGRIVELTRSGRVVWSFGAASGPNRLDRPSLAVRLPNGLIASNDDWNHRVIVIDPRSKRIVWQYGHTGVAGSGRGYLDKPDGLDLLPSAFVGARRTLLGRPGRRAAVRRIGTLPGPLAKSATVALPGGRLLVLGGTGTASILAGPPTALRVVGQLPAATHDGAAVLDGRFALLYGGGETVSLPTVLRIDPVTGDVRRLRPLDEPLSDLGAAVVRRETYLVGGFTGAAYASAILRLGPGDRTTTVARLPVGLRYAGIAALGDKVYVAGGVTPRGESRAVYVFDPGRATVRRLGMLPAPEAHAALAACRGRLYLAGGRRVLRIDARSGSVSRAGSLPQPLVDPNAVCLDGRVLVLGGGTDGVFELGATPPG